MSAFLKRRKKLIQWLLGGVLLVDLALGGINWQLATSPRTPRVELALLKRRHDLLAADVARGDRIRGELPAVQQQSSAFLKAHLRPAATGYSAVVANLGALASRAGLQTENLTFQQHQPDKRGTIEVQIAATVNGDYPSVVRFIDGLERSDDFYVLDGLSLAAGSAGQLRLNLQLRTYFRS
jgi:Type II secretion system (T2SS), protein M subtype b